ncbi:MAG: hypothetical protein KF814_11305 [Nitrospiraceae bacterium]|nr:hypothetical protein [Nitrospiraceae bacterium]
MASTIALVIQEDPRRTPRPVEALRIALGLAAGDNEITVALIGNAASLIGEDRDDIVDVDILEKYLPSFQHLGIPFVIVPTDEGVAEVEEGFTVTMGTCRSVAELLMRADRSLVF